MELSEESVDSWKAVEHIEISTLEISTLRRKWQIFPGKNIFCCNGRIMMTKQPFIFYLTCFLIIGTSSLFFSCECPHLAVTISPAIPAVGALIFVIVMSSLFRTSFIDPGIIPRATADEKIDIKGQIDLPVSVGSVASYQPPPRTKDVVIRGQVVKLKYCFTCKIFRPPRASHCSVCDNCVERFDHHCPWIGNCVGLRNYRYFYLFLVSLSLHCVFVFACVITSLILRSQNDGVLVALKDSPASLAEAIVCFFSIWSVLGIAGFHTYLAASNQTTNEDMKGSYSVMHGQDNFNPFSHGSVITDFWLTVCGPLPSSLLDRRGFILLDDQLHCSVADGSLPGESADIAYETTDKERNAVDVYQQNIYSTTESSS